MVFHQKKSFLMRVMPSLLAPAKRTHLKNMVPCLFVHPKEHG